MIFSKIYGIFKCLLKCFENCDRIKMYFKKSLFGRFLWVAFLVQYLNKI